MLCCHIKGFGDLGKFILDRNRNRSWRCCSSAFAVITPRPSPPGRTRKSSLQNGDPRFGLCWDGIKPGYWINPDSGYIPSYTSLNSSPSYSWWLSSPQGPSDRPCVLRWFHIGYWDSGRFHFHTCSFRSYRNQHCHRRILSSRSWFNQGDRR